MGKKIIEYEKINQVLIPPILHDHRIGLKLLKGASNEKELSFALGLLSHICEDAAQSLIYSYKKSKEGIPESISESLVEFYQPKEYIVKLRETIDGKDPCVLKFFFDMVLKEQISEADFYFCVNAVVREGFFDLFISFLYILICLL